MRSLKVISPGIPDSGNLLQHVMWAAGSSFVFLVKIDKSKVDSKAITKFRDHIDAHNKHIVCLGEKTLFVDAKEFLVFSMQSTAGGHFPEKDVHAEAALNCFKANVEPLLQLSKDGIEFDIVSVRSCARGVTGQNVFRLASPGE